MFKQIRKAAHRAMFISLCTVPLVVNTATAQEGDFEPVPVNFKAKDVLPKDILKGEHHTVEDQVTNNGIFNTYTVDSPFGKSTVYNEEQLAQRIDEINACELMDSINKGLIYGGAVLSSAAAPLIIAKGLVTQPATTVKNIGSGTGQFFQDLAYAYEGEDPYQGGLTKTALGYDNSKRNFAFELGVNPYGSWPPFEERLSGISWTATSGGLTVSAALTVVGGGVVGTVVSYSQTADGMRRLAVRLPPEKLKDINEEKLEAMGVPDEQIELFLDNYYYDPLEATRLVGALDAMKDVKGRNDFVVYRAVLATSTSMAMLNRQWAELMENYNRYVEKVKAIVISSGNPFMRKKDGSVLMVAPNDYLTWTQMLSVRANQIHEGLEKQGVKGKKELWFMREVTPQAKQGLENIGFVVKANVGDLIPPEEKERLKKERSAEVELSQKKGKKEIAEREKEHSQQQQPEKENK